MAHTLLFSGYGAPGCDDLAVCRLTADGTLETLSTLRHGRAPSFCCRGKMVGFMPHRNAGMARM